MTVCWFWFQVEGNFYVNDALEKLMFEELRNACRGGAGAHLAAAPRCSAGLSSALSHWSRCGRLPSGRETDRERGSAAGNRPRESGLTRASSSCQSPLTPPVSLQKSIGLPDVHSGYGFAIGNMAAFDMSDPAAVVSPGSCSLFRPLTPDPEPAEPRL